MLKGKIKGRYGNKVPLDKTDISPGEMFLSDLLVTVTEKSSVWTHTKIMRQDVV